ncbi:phage baseplate assembly protein V [Shinella sp. JR1-6]|uniref:phage baseplate assembly protein V n=1 Tax=Shinella sp. JR1-6 TaxID=2527671 RepID=UPI00102D5652|nr:phage baseplate assembly protein V [Shinella sp. JR1-6]TAA54819.1 phage baseplate protein [Shinella sp. JR1-6]
MNRRDQLIIAREFRTLYKVADDLDRRMASMFLSGTVKEVKGNLVQLEILPEDSRTGKPFLSPWVKAQEAAGQSGSHLPVKVGDPMRLISPNGEIGSQSLAVRDGYTDAAKNPTDKPQEEMIFANDGPVRLRGSKIILEGEIHLGGEGGKAVHRIGDADSDGDTAVGGATKVYAL